MQSWGNDANSGYPIISGTDLRYTKCHEAVTGRRPKFQNGLPCSMLHRFFSGLRLASLPAAIALASMLAACSSGHSPSGVIEAMHQYDHLIEKMDADSIALLYTTDGELGGIAKGRDSIRKFLASFSGVRVLGNRSESDSAIVKGDSAIQSGHYHQDVILATKDTAHLDGKFKTHWQWVKNEGWRIRKMETTPIVK